MLPICSSFYWQEKSCLGFRSYFQFPLTGVSHSAWSRMVISLYGQRSIIPPNSLRLKDSGIAATLRVPEPAIGIRCYMGGVRCKRISFIKLLSGIVKFNYYRG